MKKMVKKDNKEKLTERKSFALSKSLLIMMCKKKMRDENFRKFIEDYGNDKNPINTIKSSDWEKLKEILIKVPSLQLIGDVNAGKSYLVSELVRQDKDHVYIVLDSHGGYDFLPQIHQITPHIKESSLLVMNKMDDAAGLNFKMYKSLIQYDNYPKNFILVLEEALRYKDYGIVNMLAESRKFIKVLALMQQQIVSFIPEIHVENYNKINI